MLRTLLSTLLIGAACAVGMSQTAPQPGAPTVEQILDRYVQAVGGRAALEKVSTRITKGSYEIAGLPAKGEQEVLSKGPNMATTTIKMPGFGVIRDGYDGRTGWGEDPIDGLRELKGGELAGSKFDAEFNREMKLSSLLRQAAVTGAAQVGGREAHVVAGTAEGLGPMKMYFDKQSGLLLRMDTVRESPRGKVAFEVYFDDYREVDGVKIPFSQRWQASDFAAVIKLTSVKHNEAIDDAKFKKPSP